MFLLFWPTEQDLDVDESMISYYGKHSAKQFIRVKPIRFGFNLWCLNTRPQIDSALGLGGSVVVDLLSELPKRN